MVVVFLLVAFTVAHGSVALGMRRHAQEVEKRQHLPEIPAESESEKGELVIVVPNEKAEMV